MINISLAAFMWAGLVTAILWISVGSQIQIFVLLYGLTILLGALGQHVNPQDGLFIVALAIFLTTICEAILTLLPLGLL